MEGFGQYFVVEAQYYTDILKPILDAADIPTNDFKLSDDRSYYYITDAAYEDELYALLDAEADGETFEFPMQVAYLKSTWSMFGI